MDPSIDQTPKKHIVNEVPSRKTPISTPKNFARFLLLSNNQSFTPSPSLSQRVVRNPFENHIHERLHLPMISSPSLFQTLNTNAKQQFEWTIEDLSSFNPVNLVPHETQFREEMDPIREAQAQAAINSFFSENKIVPSPQDCSLRKQKIVLREEVSFNIANSTAMVPTDVPSHKQTDNSTRETGSQTTMTFPPQLPREVEDVLKKYNIISNCDDNFGCEVEATSSEDGCNRSMMDISTLRRKLFITRPASPELDSPYSYDANLSPAPRTPELTQKSSDMAGNCAEKCNDSLGSDMFGELSPIQAFSPANMSMNDISMMSDRHEKTPSRRETCKNIKKRGKNLSESFCLLQNSEDFQDNFIDDLLPESGSAGLAKRFGRFDSGFSADEDSKFSSEDMQF